MSRFWKHCLSQLKYVGRAHSAHRLLVATCDLESEKELTFCPFPFWQIQGVGSSYNLLQCKYQQLIQVHPSRAPYSKCDPYSQRIRIFSFFIHSFNSESIHFIPTTFEAWGSEMERNKKDMVPVLMLFTICRETLNQKWNAEQREDRQCALKLPERPCLFWRDQEGSLPQPLLQVHKL